MIQTLFGSTEKKPGLFDRMKEAVARTRENLSERIDEVVAFNKEIDRNTLDDLEGTSDRVSRHRFPRRDQRWSFPRSGLV